MRFNILLVMIIVFFLGPDKITGAPAPEDSTLGEVPIPVKMLSFYVLPDELGAKLEWTTASEKNNDYFIIDRLYEDPDGNMNQWIEIGRVSGSGTTNETTFYSYIDNDIDCENVYYRLRQIDFDGNFDTYGPVSFTRQKSSAILNVNTFPNPFTESITVNLPESSNVMVKLIDSNGAILRQIYSNSNIVVINRLNELPRGTYFLCILSNGQQWTKVMIKTD